MIPSDTFRKIWFGCADRPQMFRLFDRHAAMTGSVRDGRQFPLCGGVVRTLKRPNATTCSMRAAAADAERHVRHARVHDRFGHQCLLHHPDQWRGQAFSWVLRSCPAAGAGADADAIIARETRPRSGDECNRTARAHLERHQRRLSLLSADETRPGDKRQTLGDGLFHQAVGRGQALNDLTEAEIAAKLPILYRPARRALAAWKRERRST